LRVLGKGGKTRYVPLHPAASTLITEYLEATGHGAQDKAPFSVLSVIIALVFQNKALTPDAIYKLCANILQPLVLKFTGFFDWFEAKSMPIRIIQ